MGVARTSGAHLRVRNVVDAGIRGLKWPEWKLALLDPERLLRRCLAEADHFSWLDEKITTPMEEKEFEKIREHSELVRKDRRIVYSTKGSLTTRLLNRWERDGGLAVIKEFDWQCAVLAVLILATSLLLPEGPTFIARWLYVPLIKSALAFVCVPLCLLGMVWDVRGVERKSLLDC